MQRVSSFLAVALLLVALGFTRPASADVLISEFTASNAKTLMDEDKDYPDWIEIFNDGSEAVNLGGWSLTDQTNQLHLWTFPATNLPPNSFLIVFASGKDRAVSGKTLHANFSLNYEGGYLALVEPESDTIVSEYAPTYPAQQPDISYGMYQGRPNFFAQPTPGTNNVAGFENFVEDTKFSVDRGFYDAPIDVVITTATPDATIIWTTNGTLPSLTNGFTYTAPIHLAGTTVLRAAAFKQNYQPSWPDTQTYLFLDDIIRQSPTGQAPPGWPTSWGANVRDYGMDPDIVNNAKYSGTIKNDLKTIPSFSIVMDLKDLFNSSSGIYANPGNDGRAWERKCSLELVYPDGRKGFQINAGIRIRGGFSRDTSNPKHAFRLFFRDSYGAPKLKYPLFGDKGADSFDCLDLRTFQNYSWSFQGDSQGVFIRDQFSRDTQLDMGTQGERGDYCHLYINGQYWGLYNTCERPEASYGATYFGGNKADYDVLKVSPDNGYTIGATDGNMQAWISLYNQCKTNTTITGAVYQKLQGRNPDGTPNPEYPNLIDVDNLIDYMLVILYGGNLDAPISNFLGNDRPNNWYGMRNRNGPDGFRFMAHDSEHTLLNVNENRTGPYAAGNSSYLYSSPQWIWQRFSTHLEFRMRVADRIQKYFFNGGLLTPEACQARFGRRMAEIDRAVVGESARWGDAKRSTPLNRDNWLSMANSIRNSHMPQRSANVLAQLKAKSLYPSINAPTFNQHGGVIQPGFRLSIAAPAGNIYYTLDGSDPRLVGGAVAPSAQTYRTPLTPGESILVRARAQSGTNWSALAEASFIMAQTFTNLLVTELMYHPLPEGAIDGDEFEFIELKNANPFEIDVSGVYFTNGIEYAFPAGTRLTPGQIVVLAENATNFALRYPGVNPLGTYKGNLANSGERIALVHAVGTPLFSVAYGDQAPWPAAADGLGFSIVPLDANANPVPDDPARWRTSSAVGGSPGRDDPAGGPGGILITEVLTHTDPPALDTIELFNPTSETVDLTHWYLTDDRLQPRKYAIPGGVSLKPGEYRLFDEHDFNPQNGDTNAFLLDSHGEAVFLYAADATGTLTGYSDGFAFGAAANGVTFGRYTNSVGEIQYPAQRENTLGAANAGPRLGPVVINEIHYQPLAGDAEFIELMNVAATPVPLFDPLVPTNTWHLGGLGFSFPTNQQIAAGGLFLVVGGDPDLFRARYSVPASVPVVGPFTGALQDGGENLQLLRPDAPDLTPEGGTIVPMIVVDEVRYNDRAPWPIAAAGGGSSLERIRAADYGNDPINWRASEGDPSPGRDNNGNRAPRAWAAGDQDLGSPLFPLEVALNGYATDDGRGAPLVVSWKQMEGPAPAVLLNANRTNALARLPGVGRFVFRLTASDGEYEASDEIMMTVTRPTGEVTLVAAGSSWKYLDNGTDQGTAWREPGFNDSAWKTGVGPLGYGNDGETLPQLGYGPDPNNKYITTYFRRSFQVTGAAAATELKLLVRRDDGVAVYLNGQLVMANNLPEVGLSYSSLSTAVVSGADETTYLEQAVDAKHLREGLNVFAAEIHQCNLTSSDLGFDLALVGMMFPNDRPPTVQLAGSLAVQLPAQATLSGTVADDGLPSPPGTLTASWSKVSGPGTVTFQPADQWISSAAFEQAGTYVLRLSVSDGASTVTADTVAEVAAAPADVRLESMEVADGSPREFRFRFATEAGATYEAQYSETLGEGADWQTLQVWPNVTVRSLQAVDPIPEAGSDRFYRVLRR